MYSLRVIRDQDECEGAWRRSVPQESIWDLWEVRACFHRHFQRPSFFIAAEANAGLCGLLPLSWIEEAQCYGYFPGETWQGKTWLEQNRILAQDPDVFQGLFSQCPSAYHLRYLLPTDTVPEGAKAVDEIGYLFLPPQYNFDIENYFREFSHRTAKRLKRELAAIEELGVQYRYDDLSDFEFFVRMNIERFGTLSYFSDPRFLEGFRSLMGFLHERGWLRMTTVLVGGDVAAVDMGCIHRGAYTLLGGGTNAGFPGVAKLINLHHMRRGCEERLESVDFLCGDFKWKTLFHLTHRPLYLLSTVKRETDLKPGASV